MTAHRSRRFATMIGILVGTTPAASIAQVQEAPKSPVKAQLPAQFLGLANDFAGVVGDPVDIVSQRLFFDPGMVPLAVEAIDARTHRLRLGRKMEILGFSGAGAGLALVILGVVALSADKSVCTSEDQSGCSFQGLLYLEVIALGGLVAVGGLVVGGIGVHKLKTPSEAEEIARNRYYPAGPPRPPVASPRESFPEYSFARPSGSWGKAFRLPLLWIVF